MAHYVPGYRIAMMARDRKLWQDTMNISFRDLGLLSEFVRPLDATSHTDLKTTPVASMSTPLHRYPMHSLVQMSAQQPNPMHAASTLRLQVLAAAYSRMFLHIQTMMFSSPMPPPPEVEDTRWKANLSQMGLRELKFPEPLSYFGSDEPDENISASRKSESSTKLQRPQPRSSSAHASHSQRRQIDTRSNVSEGSGAVAASSNGHGSSKSRHSLLPGRMKVPPPPPLPEPKSLEVYARSWRRTVAPTRTPSDDEESLKPPPSRRFLGTNHSSESSLGSSPSRASARSTSVSFNDSRSRTHMTSESSQPTNTPHDLFMATSRTRAPILRVFVPCAVMEDNALVACEEQLVRFGLWDHLSVGDLVCNLGFVPPVEDEEQSNGGPEPVNAAAGETRKWLIFDGDKLSVYSPGTVPPISTPLCLPSPLYYVHIHPPFSNPRFVFSLPHHHQPHSDMPPHMYQPRFELLRLTLIVPSPASRFGRARVKRHQWIVTLRSGPFFGFGDMGEKFEEEEMGDGWKVEEWVLQAEGTKEGQDALVDALRGGPGTEREWEVVREKSGGGRLWLKFVFSALLRPVLRADAVFRMMTIAPLPPTKNGASPNESANLRRKETIR